MKRALEVIGWLIVGALFAVQGALWLGLAIAFAKAAL